jgi:hypothetical protein
MLKQAKLIDRAGRSEFKSKETVDAKSDVRSHGFESAQQHRASGDFTAQYVRGMRKGFSELPGTDSSQYDLFRVLLHDGTIPRM